MSEVDLEKAASRSDGDAEPNFATLRTPYEQTPSRNLSRRTTNASRPGTSLTHARSHNGYGIDEDGDTPRSDLDDDVQREEKDPFEVGWDNGDRDPECPRSMAVGKKWLIVLITSFSSFCVTAASSIYTSTYGQMVEEFETTKLVATIGLSTFVLGISLGPMFLSPLSEFYGRRPIYLVSWAFYIIWIIPSAVSKNIATMIVARFFDGLAGSAFLAVSGGTVGDLFSKQDLQKPMVIYSLAPFVGPSLGPFIGGFINYHVDWRWTYYVLLIWSGVIYVMLIFFVPETYHPVVLRNKAIRKRKETGDERWKAPMEKTQRSITRTIALSLLRPFQLLIYEPMALNLCLFSAILLGILYLFFGAFPLVFSNNHDFNLSQVGLSFLGIFTGMVVAALTDPLWYHIRSRLVHKLERETGIEGRSEPEFRLPPAILGAVLVPVGLFWFGWTTYRSVHWIVPIIGSAVFGAGTLMVFTGIFTFLVDAYPLYAASALAANAFVRCAFAAAFPLFGIQMYEKLNYQWASSLLAFLALAMMPFPYIFFRYGKRIRGTSRFATSSD